MIVGYRSSISFRWNLKGQVEETSHATAIWSLVWADQEERHGHEATGPLHHSKHIELACQSSSRRVSQARGMGADLFVKKVDWNGTRSCRACWAYYKVLISFESALWIINIRAMFFVICDYGLATSVVLVALSQNSVHWVLQSISQFNRIFDLCEYWLFCLRIANRNKAHIRGARHNWMASYFRPGRLILGHWASLLIIEPSHICDDDHYTITHMWCIIWMWWHKENACIFIS